MSEKIDISIVIPAFNEAKRLPLFLNRVISYCNSSEKIYEIIVVDDASTDGTFEIAESYKTRFSNLSIFRLSKNGGKGYAVKTGLTKSNGEICLFLNADGSVGPEEIRKNIHYISEEGYDIFAGSRVLRSKKQILKVKLYRKFIGCVFNFFVQTVLFKSIKDTQCGFKMFKKEVVGPLLSRTHINSFGFDIEILYLAHKMGYRVKEGPVSWHHVKGCKVNLFTDSIRMFLNILQIKNWHRTPINPRDSMVSQKGSYYYNILIYLLIFLISFFILTPIIIPKIWPTSHDGMRYILLLDHFRDAVMNGILYPRWLPDANGGYGYPTFLFYQPGFFFAALPFSFLPNYPLSTMYTTLILLLFVGGVGVYKLCKELSNSLIGFFCSILFLLTPYLYVNLYARGDLSELMAMLLCPWPMFLLIILKKRIQGYGQVVWPIFGTVLSLTMMIISHPATAMFFFAIFCVIAIYISLDMSHLKREFLLSVVVSVVLGLVLSCPYWLTVFQMKKYVNLESAIRGYFSAEFHTVSFSQFFSRYWGFGGSTVNTSGDGMSFQLGLPHFILATIGTLLGRKKRMIQISYALYLTIIFLMTPLASILWKKIIFFRYVQFPWRLLSVTATLQIICVSGLTNILPKRKSIWNKSIVMLALLCTTALWYSNQFQIDKSMNHYDAYNELKLHREQKLKNFFTYTDTNEFIPKTAFKHCITVPRGDAPLLILNPPSKMKELKGNTRYRIRYQVTSEVLTNALINQIYMPGWRVIVNGNDISSLELERTLTIDGRMQFSLSPGGNHIIEAFYEGPPGWRVRNIVIGAIVLGFITYCFYVKGNLW